MIERNEPYDKSEENKMTGIVFDTLQFAKRAEKAGFTKEQAEFQAEEALHLIENQLATKKDIAFLREDVNSSMLLIKSSIEALENKILVKVFFMLIAFSGLIISAIKFIH
jgi:hypothetical protein